MPKRKSSGRTVEPGTSGAALSVPNASDVLTVPDVDVPVVDVGMAGQGSSGQQKETAVEAQPVPGTSGVGAPAELAEQSELGHAPGIDRTHPHSVGEPLFPRADKDQLGQFSGRDIQALDLDNELHRLGPSPVNVERLAYYLQFYPNKKDADILKSGFETGFRLHFMGSTFELDVKNLKSAELHKVELEEKLFKEISLGRIIGPFNEPPFEEFKVSPIGLVPKADGGWRLIQNLSYPAGSSVNDGIDDNLCSVSYSSFDEVAHMIFNLGKDSLMAKRDVKSAFRLLPIHPADFHLLGIKVDEQYFIDRMLPMGLSLSCALFEKFSTFLHWLVSFKANITSLNHYLDDFILAGEKNSSDCATLVAVLTDTFEELGVPLAVDKSVEPTTVLTFLGLELDSKSMSIRIPYPKILELRQTLENILKKKKATLKDLQSLVGKLSFFSRAVRSSRAFLRRFYDAMIPLKRPYHRLRLSNEIRQDLKLWLVFLSEFNGISYIPEDVWLDSSGLHLFTDSTGAAGLGCGCYLDGRWAFYQWPASWRNTGILTDITFLEMVPVLLAFQLWGIEFRQKNITLHIDNEALVTVLNKQSTKSKRLMKLVREFVLLAMNMQICFKAVHISSKGNGIADSISRMQWARLKMLAPGVAADPEPLPHRFLWTISEMKPND